MLRRTFWRVEGDPPVCVDYECEQDEHLGDRWWDGLVEAAPHEGYAPTEAEAWALALSESEAKARQLNEAWNAEQERSDALRRGWYRALTTAAPNERPGDRERGDAMEGEVTNG